MNSTTLLIIGILAGAAVVGLGIWLYPRVLAWLGKDPSRKRFEPLFRQLAYICICNAYKYSEKLIDQGDERLHGVDKKALADDFYNHLPATVAGANTSIVKQLISQKDFENLVQKAFDEGDIVFKNQEKALDAWFENWKKINGPQPAAPLTPAPSPAPTQ